MTMLTMIWDFIIDHYEIFAAIGAFLGGGAAVYKLFFGKPEMIAVLPPIKPELPDEIVSRDLNVSPIFTLAMLKKVYAFDEHMYKFELEEAGEKQSFAVENIPFATFESWWRAFPTGFLIASSRGEPVAVIGIFPVTVEWADKFLARAVDEHELTAEVIRNASGKVYYVSGISTTIRTQGLSKHLPRFMLPAVFEWLRVHIETFGHEDIRLISEGSSVQGQNILERMRFTLVSPSTSPDERPRYNKLTTVTKVKTFLLENPSMSLCPELQVQVKSTFL